MLRPDRTLITLPSGIGRALDINSECLIVGHGQTAGAVRGFLLEPDLVSSDAKPRLAAKILFGIINDSGGTEIVGGVLRRIPPHAPLSAILEALPRDLATELAAIIDDLPLNGPIDEQLFSDRVSMAVTLYRRKELHRFR